MDRTARLLITGRALRGIVDGGLGFVSLSSLLPLAVVAFFGTLNPGAGDVSMFRAYPDVNSGAVR